MIRRLDHTPSNEEQDFFALEHGEAHLIEFFHATDVNGVKCIAVLASTYNEVKPLQKTGGIYRGFIRLSDFER